MKTDLLRWQKGAEQSLGFRHDFLCAVSNYLLFMSRDLRPGLFPQLSVEFHFGIPDLKLIHLCIDRTV